MQNGDRNELERLIQARLPGLLAFLTRMTGCPHRAEDLSQETLLRVLKHRDSFRGSASFKTWLYSIAVNAFRDFQKSPKNQQTLYSEEPLARQIDPIATSLQVELSEQVAMHISQLPIRQREVLVLVAYEGLRATEVAKVLGIKPTNVHANLYHARETLKEKLKEYLNEN